MSIFAFGMVHNTKTHFGQHKIASYTASIIIYLPGRRGLEELWQKRGYRKRTGQIGTIGGGR
jgi:hypothetical protein